jgi:hypothetical protein
MTESEFWFSMIPPSKRSGNISIFVLLNSIVLYTYPIYFTFSTKFSMYTSTCTKLSTAVWADRDFGTCQRQKAACMSISLGQIEGAACILRQTRCSDCTVRKCSYIAANTFAKLRCLALVVGCQNCDCFLWHVPIFWGRGTRTSGYGFSSLVRGNLTTGICQSSSYKNWIRPYEYYCGSAAGGATPGDGRAF